MHPATMATGNLHATALCETLQQFVSSQPVKAGKDTMNRITPSKGVVERARRVVR